MFRTSKTFKFSAAHALDHLDAGRQCANLHGHNYTVEVVMQASALSSDSFVRDPIDYRRIELFIRRTFDRKNLNEVFAAEFENDILSLSARELGIKQPYTVDEHEIAVRECLRTTTENIARAIFLRLRSDFPEVIAIRVGDTPETWAMYSAIND